MKNLPLITIASIIGLSFSSAAFAQNKMHMQKMKGGHHMMHMMIDTNSDGSVSAQEFQGFRSQNFSAADKNKDGSLNGQEFEALSKIMKEQRKKAMEMAKQKMAKKHFDKLDADGDGKISKAEFDSKGERSFIRMDQNDDGVLNMDDRRENKTHMKKMGNQH